MFDQLVVSSLQRRRHTSAKYFVGTGALYMLVIACAFSASVLMSDPKLADTDNVTIVCPSLAPVLGASHKDPSPRRPPSDSARPDPTRVRSLDDLLRRDRSTPPTLAAVNTQGNDDGPISALTGSGVVGRSDGVLHGDANIAPAPRPDPPRPHPAAQPTPVADNRPIRIPSSVLQGKAIDRRTPIYPSLARQIRLQGEVSVEVMIAPDGRVESARVVSGHPMLSEKAREAALGWRFQPTLLNNIPVRVTGVIVFVFKLSE